jgi:hypothetical protein
LLTSSPEGTTDYLQADLRDADTILEGAARTLDLSRPVAVLLIAVLHFIPDADDPYAIVARLMDAVPSGSCLVMAHAASDIAPEASAEMARRYNEMSSAPITPRNREQVGRFFDGLDLLPPGLVPISRWGLAGHIDATVGGLVGYCGIARKPPPGPCPRHQDSVSASSETAVRGSSSDRTAQSANAPMAYGAVWMIAARNEWSFR